MGGKTVQVRRADLRNAVDAAAYLTMLEAYMRDPMGGIQRHDRTHQARLIIELIEFPAYALLAEHAGQTIGFATCFRGYSTFRVAPILNVHDIAVLPAWRGRGVGRALLRAIEAQAHELGCCKLTLEVREDNPAATALYASEGYATARTAQGPVQYLFLEKPLI